MPFRWVQWGPRADKTHGGQKMKIRFTGAASAETEPPPGASLMAAALEAGLRPADPTCRGHGRCGLCLIDVGSSAGLLSPPDASELRLLRILKAEPGQRLACMAKTLDGLGCAAIDAPRRRWAPADGVRGSA